MTQRQFSSEIENELERIYAFWSTKSIDFENGGFLGLIDAEGVPNTTASKGLVLNARLLWSFSAYYNFSKKQETLVLADRAFNELYHHFRNQNTGGLYWEIYADGKPKNSKNQIYGIAFVIYALAEYYKAAPNSLTLNWAITLYETIEGKALDTVYGGYFEAFTEDWLKIDDLRLSDKDRNDPKTNNTHLHIIEAYANLFSVWPSSRIAKSITDLAEIYSDKIIDPKTDHCLLFFLEDWTPQSAQQSFGHDIEAAWLLADAIKLLNNEDLNVKFKNFSLTLADAAMEGFQFPGGLVHEFDPDTGHMQTHREWWVFAEGMVGFLNAFQLSNEEKYWKAVENLWDFTKKHILDHKHGEWRWGVYENLDPMHENLLGFWKCPYHNVRACLEILKRIKE